MFMRRAFFRAASGPALQLSVVAHQLQRVRGSRCQGGGGVLHSGSRREASAWRSRDRRCLPPASSRPRRGEVHQS